MPVSFPARASLLALPLSLFALSAGADLASAQAGTSCRASASRGGDPAAADFEPVVANANSDPCVTNTAQSVRTASQNGFTATNPRAATVREQGGIAASSSIESATGSTRAGAAGTVPIAVGAISSQQTVVCQAGAPVSAGTSRVEGLSIAGTPVPGVVGSNPIDLSVPTLAGPIRVRTNQLNGNTRTALILDLPGGQQQVFGEASASGNACLPLPGTGTGTGTGTGGTGNSGGTGTGGTGGNAGGANGTGPNPCPAGSEYVVADNLCVIRSRGADGRVDTIVVGRPFQGPSGGTVISLSAARKRFGNKRCLTGSGAKYVIVGTNRADRITGTNGRDRILTLGGNDRADGGRGADCLDGGSGRDILSGALGNDRVFGGTGNDSLNGGGGTDRLSGETGDDSINAGYGADVVLGGPGRDAINVATAGKIARVDCGSGRDKVRMNNREKRRTHGCEVKYVLRDA